MAKISEVGRSKTQGTPPDHGTNTEYDPLLEGQPVEYIRHIGRYVSSCRQIRVTYHSLTSLISVKICCSCKGTRFQVIAFDELQWYSVQQSSAITICHRLPISI